MDDTIAAISTALGVGAISIVRMSGKDSIEIANKIFSGCDLTKAKSHTIHYGTIKDKEEVIDEVLVSIMRSPKTYTTEDIVEINCHGGISTTNKVLELLLENGSRLANAGEFTKRAFLNGRIDLTQSEAVMDLIESKSSIERRLAISNTLGKTSKKIKEFRDSLTDLISHIEVNIDYPEYQDIEVMTLEKIKSTLLEEIPKLEEIIKSSEAKEIIKTGIKTVIVGRPNVGKSSILNSLLEYDKAIVTDIAGTTRDIVEGNINLDGIFLNIIDTAGIRQTEDVIEKIGVEKSISLLDDADLVFVVLNGNEPLTKEDKEILEKTKNRTSIVIINKTDLPLKIDLADLKNFEIVQTTTKTLDGLNSLKEKVKEMFNFDKITTLDSTYLTNSRQIALAKKALNSLKDALSGVEKSFPIDMIEIDLKEAFSYLGSILGEEYNEKILDYLFQNFCIGK